MYISKSHLVKLILWHVVQMFLSVRGKQRFFYLLTCTKLSAKCTLRIIAIQIIFTGELQATDKKTTSNCHSSENTETS